MADETDNLNINIGSDPSGIEQGARKASSSVKSVSKEAQELDAAFRRLKRTIDPTFAATEKYNRALADNKRLLQAGKIDRQEYLENTKALKVALDAQINSINRNNSAARAAAAEAKLQSRQRAAELKKAIQEERESTRSKNQEKIAAARAAAAAVEEAQRREQRAIKLSAQIARQAAIEARKLSQVSANPNVRGVAPGSISTDRSVAQLAYAAQRASEAAAKASQRAWELAAKAAAASSEKSALAFQAQSEKQKAIAEQYAARATQLARTQASEEGRLAQKAANEIRAAKKQEREAIRQAATEAKAAAKAKAAALRQEAIATREAVEATRRQAVAEKQASQAALNLRASIDPVFASQQRYNDVMRQATQLLFDNKLSQGEWVAIQKQAKAEMDVNIRSLGRMNSVYVQLGYQAQDVVASLASGINPLVILAQQGGQTAAALQQMGGRIGSVASRIAGPWGAAIIGFTLLIGLLAEKNKKAEDTTIDLTNAEARRAASLPNLIKALKDFNQEQEQANINNQKALDIASQTAQGSVDDTLKAVKDAQENLTRLKAVLSSIKDLQNQDPGGSAAAIVILTSRIAQAEKTLNEAQEAYSLARTARTNVEIRQAKARAKAATDEREAITQAYEREETAAQEAYKASIKALGPLADQSKINQAQEIFQARIEAAIKKRELAEKRVADAAKETNNVYGEGVQVFRSQAQAIQIAGRELQKQGLKVSENPLFGGITPGAHRTSHKNAIDVNLGTGSNEGSDPSSKARFDAIARSYQSRGYRVLWNGAIYEPGGDGPGPLIPTRTGSAGEQHTNHLHLEAPSSIVGKPTNQGDTAQLFQSEREARREAIATFVEDIEYQQSIAQEDYQEQLRLQDEKIEALKGFYGEQSAEVTRAARERLAIERRYQQFILNEQRDRINQELDAARAAEDLKAEIAEIDRGQRGDNVSFNDQNRIVSEKQTLVEKIKLLDEEYQANLAHEQRLYELRAQAVRDQLALANLPEEEKRKLLKEQEQLEIERNNRSTVLYRQYVRDVNNLSNELAALQAQRWREIAQTISQSIGSAIQGLLTRSISFKDALIQIADQLLFKFIDIGIKMVENWVLSLLTRKAATTAATTAETAAVVGSSAAQTAAVVGGQTAQTTAKVAAAATEGGIIAATTGAKVASEAIKSGAAVAGATTSKAATAGAGISEVTTNAAVAAAGAYKSTVVIPFIGPVAAPAAAALALAAVLGFGALISARGGQARVPQDGQITELHKDEMVLPAYIATPLRNSLASLTPRNTPGSFGTSSSQSIDPSVGNSGNQYSSSVSVSIPITAIDTQSGADFIMKNQRTIAKAVEEAVRKGMKSSR